MSRSGSSESSRRAVIAGGSAAAVGQRDVVLFHYSIELSRRVPIVVTEDSTEPLPAGDAPRVRFWDALVKTEIKHGHYLIVGAMVVLTLSGALAGRAGRGAAVVAAPSTRVAPRGPSA